MSHFDLVVHGGLVFDGRGNPPKIADVAIQDGVIAAVSELPLPVDVAGRRIDARGAWVTPGFIDFHTHYDVEVEVAPTLSESLRHGVTTVTLGSCSIGATLGTPEEIADIFCRVEAVPRPQTLEILNARKSWSNFAEYFDHLSTLPLGPNVTAFVGHSNLRIATMGFRRAVQREVKPTRAEVQAMERLLEEGLDAGYLGMSIQTLPWDKLDGDVHPGHPLPSY
ncbi:MAG: amidohydrolase family protein, partial [Nannocystaceae bacterium]